MNRRIASLALLFCLTTPLLAQPGPDARPEPAAVTASAEASEAKIVLDAPSTARIGELVRLDVSASNAASFKWLLVPESDDFLTYDAGARAVFSARTAGEYRFIVACGAEDGSVDVVTHVVRVPEPPSKPVSDSLAEWIPYWNWSMDLPQSECLALADSFDDIADKQATLSEPKDWIEATAAANREVLGDRIDAWTPMLDKIGAKLLKMAESGALQTPEEHAKVWREIARGLRAC